MNDLERRGLLSAAGLVGFAALARSAKAGPLDPPPGPVAPSGRTLDEIYNRIPGTNGSGDGRIAIPASTSPVLINAPGSYVLTGNLTLTAGNALRIASNNVTVDLNGYTVKMLAAAGNYPIFIVNQTVNVSIRNGKLVGGDVGLFLGLNSEIVLEELHISSTRFGGIFVSSGSRSVAIRRCTLFDIGAGSVSADTLATVTGIDMANCPNMSVTDNTIAQLSYNGQGSAALTGISAGISNSGVIARNTITNSASLTGVGMFVGSGVYRDNTVVNFTTKYQTGANAINGGGNV